ncbi:uncharacterized protein LOC125680888 [Ostrea edulis]|uniref:uncharacterized protein LOC125680888 n=1 Tax=Ostrea edulis TaxID=37623 RepID=UPI0024AECBD5|nr:uncharacterized protein LOC125680888 [Ostrea edulis]
MERFVAVVKCLTFFVIALLIYENGLFNKVNIWVSTIYDYETSKLSFDSMYLINTPGCRIPNFEAFDLSIREKIQPGKFANCAKNPSFVEIKSNCLKINREVVKKSHYKNSFSFCRVHSIFRPRQGKHHDYFRYVNESILTDKQMCFQSNMLRVQCFDNKNVTIYTNFHWIHQNNNSFEDICDERTKNRKDKSNITETLSVLLLGIDSTSRLNSHRFFTKTRHILTRKLNSIEFRGHNIVGMDTFMNVVPLLTGKSIYELKEDGKFGNTTMDDFHFIWKDYEENGYRTLYAEDAAYMSVFDYLKPGFRNFPTHFYNRPWSVAWWYANAPRCMGGRSEPEAIMEYMTQFVEVYQSKPYFSFAFLSSLTHDSQELSAEMDEIMSKFFNKALESNALNNTIVLFFADHGLRIGSTRWSDIGSYEVLSPMFFISTPGWFSKKYRTIDRNLRNNAYKLTTVYDIHETLRNILNFSGQVQNHSSPQRGESLFTDVFNTRNCTDVGIPLSMCTCSQYIEIKNFTSVYADHDLSAIIISKLNELVKDHTSICAHLSLDKTISVFKAAYGKRQHTYRITIRTLPGKAMFEASVYVDSSRNKLKVGPILRINRYGNQSKCVNDYFLRNYCYCKKM